MQCVKVSLCVAIIKGLFSATGADRHSNNHRLLTSAVRVRSADRRGWPFCVIYADEI